MPELNLDENNAKYQIRAFKRGCIQINDQIFTKSVIVSSNLLITDWDPQDVTELTSQHLELFHSLKPTILIIGTGPESHLLPIELYGNLLNQGIGVEIMNTTSACHTYSALTAEGRNVVAALFLK